MKAKQSANYHKQQRPQTVRPQHPKVGTRKQSTSKMSRRLSRASPTFVQLLAKYLKEKAVPHDRPIKQSKSKSQSVQRQRPTKPTPKVVQPRSPTYPPLGMSWYFPVYSSPMCCPIQVLSGTTMNLYYLPNTFTYSG
jgi:hypothetical protein